jgi:hypothetical protein
MFVKPHKYKLLKSLFQYYNVEICLYLWIFAGHENGQSPNASSELHHDPYKERRWLPKSIGRGESGMLETHLCIFIFMINT